ncbi:MAG: Ribonuclease P protein component [Chlamydiae bacterium]|nr:Ribonuclease P protein component [Chlamydiota bacterium]
MWVSQKDVNRRGPKSDQPSPSQRAQALKRISLSFPKSARILKRGHFKALAQNRCRFVGDAIIINYRTGASKSPKLGLTVPRQFGNAVKRNRFKRLVREVFRTRRQHFFQQLEMNVFPKKGADISKEGIANDLLNLNMRIQTGAHSQSPAETSR